jgi:hypothetical protein
VSNISLPNFLLEDIDRAVVFEQAEVLNQLAPLDTNINFEYNGANSLEGGRLELDYISSAGRDRDSIGVIDEGTGAGRFL